MNFLFIFMCTCSRSNQKIAKNLKLSISQKYFSLTKIVFFKHIPAKNWNIETKFRKKNNFKSETSQFFFCQIQTFRGSSKPPNFELLNRMRSGLIQHYCNLKYQIKNAGSAIQHQPDISAVITLIFSTCHFRGLFQQT